MFGNKNSAIPYVRVGGVDRQSILTSNANGNTPVKEIGVDANGNLVFSVDWTTFKSVLDLKYSQFKSNDEDQNDTWETEKSVSMIASGTLEDGTTKETAVIVSQEYSAMASASMKDDTGSVSQISVTSKDASLYSTDGTSTTQLIVTPTGALVNNKTIATTDELPNLDDYLKLNATATQTIAGGIRFSGQPQLASTITDLSGNNIAGVVANLMTFGANNFTTRIIGKDVRPKYATTYGTSASDLHDLALYSDLSSYLPLAGGTLTGDLKLTVGKNIVDSNNKALITTNANGVIFGDPTSLTSIKGSQVRPFYTSGSDNTTKALALLSDVPSVEQSTGTSTTGAMSQKATTDALNGKIDWSTIVQATGTNTDKVMSQNAVTNALNDKISFSDLTSAGTAGGNTSGGLILTAGHLYRIYVGMGNAQLSCMVKMPSTMVEQYWFMGINLYGHYVRLHISSAGVVTYQYANIGQTNWADNNSVYISYEDITSKS